MKKKLAVLLCTAMAVSSLAGCSSGAESPGKDRRKPKRKTLRTRLKEKRMAKMC